MAEFAGLIHFDRRPVDPAEAAMLVRSVCSTGRPRISRPDPSVAFVQGGSASAGVPAQAEHGAPFLLIDAWLEAPAELAASLGLDGGASHQALVGAACGRWGAEAAIERVHGDVSVAEWDGQARRLVLARDAFGGMPLYYVCDERRILFGSALQIVLAMPGTPRDLDMVTVAHTMTLALQDQERTIYRHVRRVPPGGVAIVEGGAVRTRRYYSLESIAPVRLGSDDAYVEAARERLDAAVASCLPASGPYASQLSGGFDSAAVTATAARLLGAARLTAYTRVPAVDVPVQALDERGLAGLLVERHSNIDWRIIDEMRTAARDLDPRSEAGAAMVPRTSSFNATWMETLVIAAERSGASVLLSGVSGNLTLSYEGAPALGARLNAAVRRPADDDREDMRSGSRTAASALFRSLAPRALKRLRQRQLNGADPWLRYALVSPRFLADLDYAAHAEAVGHDLPFDLPYGSREKRLRLLQAQRARDFIGYARRRRSAAMAHRDPLRNRRLIELCIGMPERQYWRDGQDRWLARRVLADRVPAETLAMKAVGQQSPDWYVMATARRDQMAETVERIARSPLAGQVLDVARMRSLLDTWPKDAEAAAATTLLHGHALQRALAMGMFLHWHEGRND